jgi:hypothetical protein
MSRSMPRLKVKVNAKVKGQGHAEKGMSGERNEWRKE